MKKICLIVVLTLLCAIFTSCGVQVSTPNGGIGRESSYSSAYSSLSQSSVDVDVNVDVDNFLPPALVCTLDLTKTDPSNDVVQFAYDGNRVINCYYIINNQKVTQNYVYNDNRVIIHSYCNSTVVNDAEFNILKTDDSIGFTEEKGYYFRGMEVSYAGEAGSDTQNPPPQSSAASSSVDYSSNSTSSNRRNNNSNSSNNSTQSGYTTYTNQQYGWSVQLPPEWNKYGDSTKDSSDLVDSVLFCHSEIWRKYGVGLVFQISCVPSAQYESVVHNIPHYGKLGENEGYTFYWVGPSDLQVPQCSDFDRLYSEYKTLYNSREQVLSSFKLP